jgi:hypothetical protein
MSTRKTDRHAVGALFRAAATGRIALGLRSCGCGNPHTYGPIGGEIDPGEMVIDTVSKVLFRKHLELSPYFRSDGELLEFTPATA